MDEGWLRGCGIGCAHPTIQKFIRFLRKKIVSVGEQIDQKNTAKLTKYDAVKVYRQSLI